MPYTETEVGKKDFTMDNNGHVLLVNKQNPERMPKFYPNKISPKAPKETIKLESEISKFFDA